jgi:hypothetical protein
MTKLKELHETQKKTNTKMMKKNHITERKLLMQLPQKKK